MAGASEGDVAAVEYALWLTMDVLGAVLRRRECSVGLASSSSKEGQGRELYDASRAGEDAERVLTCVRENPSPQTRRVILVDGFLSGVLWYQIDAWFKNMYWSFEFHVTPVLVQFFFFFFPRIFFFKSCTYMRSSM